MVKWGAAAVAVVMAGACAARTAPDAAPAAAYQIELPAHPREDNPAPAYPAGLRAERPAGRVVLDFTVTAEGTVDTSTVEVVESSHPLFTTAARAVLPRLRFYPAELRVPRPGECRPRPSGAPECREGAGRPGRRVAGRVRVPFEFAPPA